MTPGLHFQEKHVAVETDRMAQCCGQSWLSFPLLAVNKYAVNWTPDFDGGFDSERCYLFWLTVKIYSKIRTQACILQYIPDLKPLETLEPVGE